MQRTDSTSSIISTAPLDSTQNASTPARSTKKKSSTWESVKSMRYTSKDSIVNGLRAARHKYNKKKDGALGRTADFTVNVGTSAYVNVKKVVKTDVPNYWNEFSARGPKLLPSAMKPQWLKARREKAKKARDGRRTEEYYEAIKNQKNEEKNQLRESARSGAYRVAHAAFATGEIVGGIAACATGVGVIGGIPLILDSLHSVKAVTGNSSINMLRGRHDTIKFKDTAAKLKWKNIKWKNITWKNITWKNIKKTVTKLKFPQNTERKDKLYEEVTAQLTKSADKVAKSPLSNSERKELAHEAVKTQNPDLLEAALNVVQHAQKNGGKSLENILVEATQAMTKAHVEAFANHLANAQLSENQEGKIQELIDRLTADLAKVEDGTMNPLDSESQDELLSFAKATKNDEIIDIADALHEKSAANTRAGNSTGMTSNYVESLGGDEALALLKETPAEVDFGKSTDRLNELFKALYKHNPDEAEKLATRLQQEMKVLAPVRMESAIAGSVSSIEEGDTAPEIHRPQTDTVDEAEIEIEIEDNDERRASISDDQVQNNAAENDGASQASDDSQQSWTDWLYTPIQRATDYWYSSDSDTPENG